MSGSRVAVGGLSYSAQVPVGGAGEALAARRTIRRLKLSLIMLLLPMCAMVVVSHRFHSSEEAFRPREVASVSVDTSQVLSGESWRDVVPSLMIYNPILPKQSLQLGTSFSGSTTRMQMFVSRLLRGTGVKVVAVGGSTTAGAGSYRGNVYHRRYFRWLRDTFPQRAGQNVTLATNGLGATPSALFNACSQRMVAKAGHLYILEFAVNDPWNEGVNGPTRHGFEQLIRKLLRTPNRPAVVLLMQYAWATSRHTFFRSAEPDLTVLGQYYDLPVLSMRNAVWPQLGKPGFWVNSTVSDVVRGNMSKADETWRLPLRKPQILAPETSYLFWDGVHPSDQTGQRVLADLLVDLTRRATVQLLGESEEWWRGGRLGPSNLPGIPEPMFPHNFESNSSSCFAQADLLKLVSKRYKFEWKARKPEAATRVLQQWGLHAEEPGAWVRLSLDTRLNRAGATEHHSEKDEGIVPKVDLVLGVVRSWRGYGLAKVRCEFGCLCDPTIINGKWQYNNTQASLVPVSVTQVKNCTINISILPDAKNGGTKFEMRAALLANKGSQLFSRPDNHGDAVAQEAD